MGIAMGQSGSDVAKEASDIVLTDDNFASIVNAIEEGRRMFDNIQKFILHLLAENIAQACTLLVGLAFKDARGLSVFPLAPVEIMWIIMITSGLPDMGLGFEVAAPDVMKRPPHDLKRGVFTTEVMVDMVFYGIWIAALCLGTSQRPSSDQGVLICSYRRFLTRCFRLRRRQSWRKLQRSVFGAVSRGFSRARHDIRLLDLVRSLPCLGTC